MSLRTAHSISELVMTWGRGRAVSRLTPPPVDVPGGFRVLVDASSGRVRHVLHDYTPEHLTRLASAQTDPGSQIMIAGPTSLLVEALPPGWELEDAGHLMSTPLTPHEVKPPEDYRIEVVTEGALSVATAYGADGETAASARLGRSGEFGVFDQVKTVAEHRRRGLGSALMRALSNRAVELGMTSGLLVGSDDGRALYEALGWDYRSDFPWASLKDGV